MSDETAIPAFGRGVKFRFDTVRKGWVLLAPERVYVPNDIAVEILKLVDGERSIGAIADTLSVRFDAARDLIAADVIAVLDDLSARGGIQL
ncbi:pyrroloquinoline quinone biosynthesis peptide chaperone PqqD [Pseudoroseomonas globiformis]|uniref:Pyrroloquinoline quinone biosynthesis peptide chaperone PqqD n=1 Tax=Teichococcus globiformis TaxID=2307229 RepID=A0ABV7G7H3_9PROT